MSKKILIITSGFYPDQSPRSFRATELAKEFCRQGHSVKVVAPEKPGMNKLQQQFNFEYHSIGQLRWTIFNFSTKNKLGRLYNKVVNRALPLFLDYPNIELFFKVKKYLKSESTQFDILISIAVPYSIHWGVASAWNDNKVANVWVADCGDPYSLQENDTINPPFYFHWVEKWFMKKVDFITVPTENSYKGYFPEFHQKIKVIPQGFRFEDIKKGITKEDGVLRFGYGGGFILGRRDPTYFLQYLIDLPKDLKFEFHIYTKQLEIVQPFSNVDGRIIVHPVLDRIHLLEKFSTFDFLVNFSNVGKSQTPSKLIDYAILNKPILQIEQVLNIGIIHEFLNKNFVNQLVINDIDHYRIDNVTNAFLNLRN